VKKKMLVQEIEKVLEVRLASVSSLPSFKEIVPHLPLCTPLPYVPYTIQSRTVANSTRYHLTDNNEERVPNEDAPTLSLDGDADAHFGDDHDVSGHYDCNDDDLETDKER
jgi:hypothetical protein